MQAAIRFPDLSPEIFSVNLFGIELALRWYALAYIVGLAIGWRVVVAALRRPALWPMRKPPMAPEMAEDLLSWCILGVILGGRLGYVVFYKPAEYLAAPFDILKIWEGGMSFHGGMLGVVLVCWLYFRRHGIPYGSGSDMMALGVAPGLLLGRIANFINAELWGRPTDLPWGVIFPGGAAQECGQALGELCARHPSQLYEALLEGVLLGGLVLWLAFRRGALHRPLRIAGLFFAGYGLSRFAVEFVRQPDAQFVGPGNPLGLAWEVGGYGLTQGQALSLPMIMVGLWLVARSRKAADG